MSRILISGAGIGGPTLATLLARQGHEVTIVERSAGIRSSGAPIDVRGPAIAVAQRLGVMDHIRSARTKTTGIRAVNAKGETAGRLKMPAGPDDVELPRGDLAAILLEKARDHAEIIFSDSISGIEQHADGVDVTFERSAPRSYDLIVGADGLHSIVRRLAFGPEERFIRHAGMYAATMPLNTMSTNDTEMIMFNAPGRAIALHPSRGKALAAFFVRSPQVAEPDPKRLLTEAFSSDGWRVPELMAAVRETDDLWFDAVSIVQLDSWTDGRVTLLGDAASCVSLFGGGSSLAMAGAGTLADAIAQLSLREALRQFEKEHRKRVGPAQRTIRVAEALVVPRTRAGIALRNFGTRFMPTPKTVDRNIHAG